MPGSPDGALGHPLDPTVDPGMGGDGSSSLAVQIRRFLLSGVANSLFGFLIIAVAYQGLGLGLVWSNVLGYGAGLVLSFLLNRNWTFADQIAGQGPGQNADHNAGRIAGRAGSVTMPAICFAAVVGAGLGLNLLVVTGVMRAGLAFVPAQIAGILAYSITTFIGFRHVVFIDRS